MKKTILFTSLFLLMGCSASKESASVNSPSVNQEETPIISTSENTSIETSTPTVSLDRKVKVYLNPSVQTWNNYVLNLGTEAEHMNNIAHYMYEDLKEYEFLDVKANFDYLSLNESVKESNAFKADIHFAIHSNAGGGNGSEILTKGNQDFAKAMYDGFMELGNFKRRGIKDGSSLYEIKNSKAQDKALIELLFHDNETEARYIVNNEQEIAHKLANTLVDYVVNNY